MEDKRIRDVFRKDMKRIALVVAAALVISMTIKIFVNAGGLFPGGFTGVAVLLQRCFATYLGLKLPYSVIYLLLNGIPAYISFKTIGKKFTGLSCLCIVLTSIFTDLIPAVPITYDMLLISIFGGITMGMGISLCLIAEATSGGTDFVAMYFSQKHGIDAFGYILAGNIVMLAVAGLLFGWDGALYSIIFQFCSTQVVHTTNKRYKRNTLLIVTAYPEAVAEAIYRVTYHGATKLEATGSYTGKDRPIVYSIVSSDKVKKCLVAIKKIDPEAFVNVIKTDEITGNFYIPPMD